jgi:hypothetical protein
LLGDHEAKADRKPVGWSCEVGVCPGTFKPFDMLVFGKLPRGNPWRDES